MNGSTTEAASLNAAQQILELKLDESFYSFFLLIPSKNKIQKLKKYISASVFQYTKNRNSLVQVIYLCLDTYSFLHLSMNMKGIRKELLIYSYLCFALYSTTYFIHFKEVLKNNLSSQEFFSVFRVKVEILHMDEACLNTHINVCSTVNNCCASVYPS